MQGLISVGWVLTIFPVRILWPVQPYTPHRVQGKLYFYKICPCANGIVYGRLEVVRTLLYLFEQF